MTKPVPNMKESAMRFATIIAGVVLIGLVACSRESTATKAAWDFQRARLKAPGTAKLVSSVVDMHQSWAMVTLVYDAQNNYGAYLRGETVLTLDWNRERSCWIPTVVSDKK